MRQAVSERTSIVREYLREHYADHEIAREIRSKTDNQPTPVRTLLRWVEFMQVLHSLGRLSNVNPTGGSAGASFDVICGLGVRTSRSSCRPATCDHGDHEDYRQGHCQGLENHSGLVLAVIQVRTAFVGASREPMYGGQGRRASTRGRYDCQRPKVDTKLPL